MFNEKDNMVATSTRTLLVTVLGLFTNEFKKRRELNVDILKRTFFDFINIISIFHGLRLSLNPETNPEKY